MRDSTRRPGRTFLVAGLVGLALGVPAHGQSQAPAPASPPAAAAAMPSAEQIVNRYVQVAGGRAAWQKLSSRVSKGTIEAASLDLKGTIEIYEKAPNRILALTMIAGASFRQGFDGTVGWTDDPENGLREVSGAELAEARRDADFYRPLDMQKLYTKLTVTGEEKIGERRAYVMEAAVPEGGDPDRIYFDEVSGFPLRLVTQQHELDDVSEVREDFEDYRDVDGIKMPFTIRQMRGETTLTIQLSDVQHNVAIENGRFSKPAAE